MTEVQLYNNRVRALLTALHLDPRRVENVLGAGTPDVNYTVGWIELKVLANWPKPTRPVKLPKLLERKEQVAFLVKRWTVGAPCWLLLGVGSELLLFSGFDAHRIKTGSFTKSELYEMAAWTSHVDTSIDTLWNMLTWGDTLMPPWQKARWCRLRATNTQQEVADKLGWPKSRVVAAESVLGVAPQDTSDLIEYWEC